MSRSTASITPDGDHVILQLDGKAWRMPWDKAFELGQGLHQAAKQAEEFAHANRVIADQALLMKAGVPIGLSRNSKILAEAKKVAENDLRKVPLAGVESTAIVGHPSIRKN